MPDVRSRPAWQAKRLGVLVLALLSPGVVAETYRYDLAGRLVAVLYDDGAELRFTYDANGNSLSRTVSLPDSDGDGIPDNWEDFYGLDSAVAGDALLDDDMDGLTNFQEYANRTLPSDPDSDDDGVDDGREVAAGSDPLDATDIPVLAEKVVPLINTLLLGE